MYIHSYTYSHELYIHESQTLQSPLPKNSLALYEHVCTFKNIKVYVDVCSNVYAYIHSNTYSHELYIHES